MHPEGQDGVSQGSKTEVEKGRCGRARKMQILDTRSFLAPGLSGGCQQYLIFTLLSLPCSIWKVWHGEDWLPWEGRLLGLCLQLLSPIGLEGRERHVYTHQEQDRGGCNHLTEIHYCGSSRSGHLCSFRASSQVGRGGRKPLGHRPGVCSLIHLQAPSRVLAALMFPGLRPCKPGPIQTHRNAPQANGHQSSKGGRGSPQKIGEEAPLSPGTQCYKKGLVVGGLEANGEDPVMKGLVEIPAGWLSGLCPSLEDPKSPKLEPFFC